MTGKVLTVLLEVVVTEEVVVTGEVITFLLEVVVTEEVAVTGEVVVTGDVVRLLLSLIHI